MGPKIVVGLGFGDEGKGITTDWLCSQAPHPLVIRFSGGQQCGHTVMIDGKKHVHSSFGSGTLRGVPSYFTEHTTIYPLTMANEIDVLAEKGRLPKLYVHPLAKVTTPYDVVYNRVTERSKGHGSCGLGIAATMKRNADSPIKLYAVDLTMPAIYEQKLETIRKYYLSRPEISSIGSEAFLEEVGRYLASYMSACKRSMFKVRDYSLLLDYEDWIFEGSQGVMLDASHGLFPNVTYANTTSRNAVEICNKFRKGYEVYYVTRCYQTRHGAGWMSNEGGIEQLINNQEEINVFNKWQRDFRIGELDYDLLNYALQVDEIYSGTANKNLVVTCLDQRPDFNFEVSKLETNFKNIYSSKSPITNIQWDVMSGHQVK